MELIFEIVVYLMYSHQRWLESLFFTPGAVPKRVTSAPAPELFGNLHSNSCLHSENLKAMSILPH